MDAQKLGRRIREAHLARRLTRSEVVGDSITHNMFSQIESSTAISSIETLGYSSKVLSVPMSQLVPGDDLVEALTQAKTVPAQEQAERTLPLVGDFIYDLHDESDAIAARTCLMLARWFTQHHEYVSAATHAHLAAGCAQRGIYACADVHVNVFSLLGKIEQP